MKLKSLYVAPVLPPELKPLRDIAMNLWFSWNWDAVRLFIRIDAELWEQTYQNPVAMLGRVSQARLKELARDESFVANVERVNTQLKEYLQSKKWYQENYSDSDGMKVAYFCCEYGLDEGLPVYSGGLGVLAGDHMKAASDLGIPIVGVGLLYRQGYFRQRLNADGWQLEDYPENDWYNMPVNLIKDEAGQPHVIHVTMGDKQVMAQIWCVDIGHVKLYLLDTNFEANSPWAREITTQLYGGDRDMRIRQELLLGIGGYRALKVVGYQPTVYHVNEGHSAFLLLERIRDLMENQHLSFKEAREIVWASNVFTTHTPVPAGNEQFDTDLLKRYLEPKVTRLGITWDDFVRMGRVNPDDKTELFGMTVWALRNSAFSNGVSRLHGHVSRKMWNGIWPNLPENEVPINHITNGIHTRSWLSHDMGDLFDSYLGPRFAQKPWQFDVWDRIERIPTIELWRTHQRRRERLVFFARKRLQRQLARRGAHHSELAAADEVLNPQALTIGLARRFATYKRSNLIFRDKERLRRLISNPEQPVQFIIAGKAHPQDIPGKEIIKDIIHSIREQPFRSHIVFLEDYDINVARYLVQGVDVWLNTPRRPLEASGTSGMKAAANGALNLSILDGWWDEAYDPEVGFAIGNGEEYQDHTYQDDVECKALFNCLENEIVPLFFDRDSSGIPRKWVDKMKSCISRLGRQFNVSRMLQEYTELLYLQAHSSGLAMQADGCERAKAISAWRQKVRATWNRVAITNVQVDMPRKDLQVGDKISFHVEARLGDLTPDDVEVDVFCGVMDSRGNLEDGKVYMTHHVEQAGGDVHKFSVDVPFWESGRHGYAVRVSPYHPDLVRSYASEFVVWG
ncbi:MAG: alpha-glucan family phosphorylase [bacterium]|nr:alpha-glucan family phosphorylase [bacterium]